MRISVVVVVPAVLAVGGNARAYLAGAGVMGGCGLLDGETGIQIELTGDELLHGRLAEPPGSPRRPPSTTELESKLAACGPDVPELLTDITWDSAAELMRTVFPAETHS